MSALTELNMISITDIYLLHLLCSKQENIFSLSVKITHYIKRIN